ncbi:hypothetical protein [Oceanicaulis sp. UBA2681]|uniref:hypothetical protein n=1 Tax=Oceanicaulis sp. UBA2681 TaxID=1947007 RepID=UPI0013592F58|nr:hypothetical protein [Oceanicaulis sp. UBA2681]
MSADPTRLNIERAREALARARMDDVASAVRAPRPADLSRLEEHQARAETLSERATDFRDSVRSRLGLGEASGGSMSYAHSASSASGMDAALCDAEVCAPAPPRLNEVSRPAASSASLQATDRPDTAGVTPQIHAEHGEARRRKFLGLF